jgi:hypothetical protein
MAKVSKPSSKRERLGVSTAGIVEALEQDVELSVEQVKKAAHDAVAAVEKKLGARKAAKPKPTPAKMSKIKKNSLTLEQPHARANRTR